MRFKLKHKRQQLECGVNFGPPPLSKEKKRKDYHAIQWLCVFFEIPFLGTCCMAPTIAGVCKDMPQAQMYYYFFQMIHVENIIASNHDNLGVNLVEKRCTY